MKRTLLFCIVLCLTMTGCSHTGSSWQSPDLETKHADGTVSQTTETERAEAAEEKETVQPKEDAPEESDPVDDLPNGAFAANYDGPEDRSYRAVIYETTAYYECDPYNRVPWQPHIYSIPLGGETATDLLKGELIGLAESVLIGKTDTHFCAMDLSASSPQWVELRSAGEYIAHLQMGDTLYLYLCKDGEYAADIVDLKTLQAERMAAVNGLRQVTAVGDQIFHLTADGFYRGDPLKKSSELLCAATEEDQLYLAGDCIFIYRDCALPRVYNAKTQTVAVPELLEAKITSTFGPYPEVSATTPIEQIPLNSYQETPTYTNFYDETVMIQYYEKFRLTTLYYDIAADEEITDINARYPGYTQATVAEGGYYFFADSQRNYYVNGKKHSIIPTDAYSDYQKHYELLSENGAVHVYGNAVITVNFQTGQYAAPLHRNQKVTQE